MTYLLDTHTLIWYICKKSSLPESARKSIRLPSNSIYVSIASLWEVAIKVSLGKLRLELAYGDFIEAIKSSKIHILPIKDS